MIVGITGPLASGKNVLVQMFVEKGFKRITLSEEVREEARKKGIEIERTNLQDLGNEMRQLYGPGHWARRLIAKIDAGKNYVIEGIKNPGEIDDNGNCNRVLHDPVIIKPFIQKLEDKK